MNLIARDELRKKLERGDEFKLVMTLSALAYEAKHIPTSLHFDTADDMLHVLDPREEIIVYCADLHCVASIYAYRLLERHGYRRVHRYAGGVADWEQAGYPLVQASVPHARPRPSRGFTRRPPRIAPCGGAP
jgi:rhodanese-related sulfurtransferase